MMRDGDRDSFLPTGAEAALRDVKAATSPFLQNIPTCADTCAEDRALAILAVSLGDTVSLTLENRNAVPVPFSFRFYWEGKNFALPPHVGGFSSERPAPPGVSSYCFSLPACVAAAKKTGKKWSPAHPYLYRLTVFPVNGSEKRGVCRSVTAGFPAENGDGAVLLPTSAALLALPEKRLAVRLLQLKSLGVDGLFLSDGKISDRLLAFCDHGGILLGQENVSPSPAHPSLLSAAAPSPVTGWNGKTGSLRRLLAAAGREGIRMLPPVGDEETLVRVLRAAGTLLPHTPSLSVPDAVLAGEDMPVTVSVDTPGTLTVTVSANGETVFSDTARLPKGGKRSLSVPTVPDEERYTVTASFTTREVRTEHRLSVPVLPAGTTDAHVLLLYLRDDTDYRTAAGVLRASAHAAFTFFRGEGMPYSDGIYAPRTFPLGDMVPLLDDGEGNAAIACVRDGAFVTLCSALPEDHPAVRFAMAEISRRYENGKIS